MKPATVSSGEPLLECTGIGMRFGGAVALDGVDFTLMPGEVHGLVGTNGAGKSTLMKILAGVLPDHDGAIRLRGQSVHLASPRQSLELGIAMVYQELSGIGQLSVAENLFLGRQTTARWGRIDWRGMRSQARAYLAELEIAIDARRRLDRYPLVIRQMVEIARGVHSGARILILDEPTSSLSSPEIHRLFELIRALKARGVAVVFISHFIEDVLAISDRVTILRDGRRVRTAAARELDKHAIIHEMLGHPMNQPELAYETSVTLPSRAEPAPAPLLEVHQLSLPGVLRDVTLSVSAGECLGLYGFVGAGHQELAHIVAGALTAARGSVQFAGNPLPSGKVHEAVRRGIVLVAADRARTLVRGEPVYRNVTLPHLGSPRSRIGRFLTSRGEIRVAGPILEQVGCQPNRPRLRAGNLSGGNQQKVVLGKWLLDPIRVLVLEEPTRGMDVGAKEEVMHLVARQKEMGAAVILATTEPELAMAHSDRIIVFRKGRIAREFASCRVDKRDLVQSA